MPSMESLDHELRERLRHVLDPELGASIVDLGMVGDITVTEGIAHIAVALTTRGCPLRQRIEREVTQAALEVAGVHSVVIEISEMAPDANAALMDTARRIAQDAAPTTTIPRTTPVIAVMSGKGGVGKSSITANMAVALARRGFVVGVIDADIWGFSLPRLLGIEGSVEAIGGKMQPLVRHEASGEIRLLSMGFLSDDDRALLWRGLIVQRAVQQFIEDADWTGIDYLLIDTHPGLNEETLLSITISDVLLLILRPDRQDFQGTAVTVEAVDLTGKFLGGLILPGHGIMLRALESGTAGLRVATGDVRPFPTNTSAALTSGGTYAIAGAVERMVQHVRQRCGVEPLNIMTGGAGWKMLPSMGIEVDLVESLIFDGLLVIAQGSVLAPFIYTLF